MPRYAPNKTTPETERHVCELYLGGFSTSMIARLEPFVVSKTTAERIVKKHRIVRDRARAIKLRWRQRKTAT